MNSQPLARAPVPAGATAFDGTLAAATTGLRAGLPRRS
ncbi:hypothetical protein ABIB17_002086 [Arthrobacter sp. UYEF6]